MRFATLQCLVCLILSPFVGAAVSKHVGCTPEQIANEEPRCIVHHLERRLDEHETTLRDPNPGPGVDTVTTVHNLKSAFGIPVPMDELSVTITASKEEIDMQFKGRLRTEEGFKRAFDESFEGRVSFDSKGFWRYTFILKGTKRGAGGRVDTLQLFWTIQHISRPPGQDHQDDRDMGITYGGNRKVSATADPKDHESVLAQRDCTISKHRPHFDCVEFSELKITDISGDEIRAFSGRLGVVHMSKIPKGYVGGDPHFMTWYGDWFDFHGICDMIFLRNPEFGMGLGLEIHVRSKGRYEYSYIESAVIRIGDDVLEVGSFGEHWFNGVENAKISVVMAKKYALTHTQANKNQHKYVISLDEEKGESIVVKTFKDLVSVTVENATDTDFGKSQGLLGSFEDGAMLARDGATVMYDHNLFGQEWQVSLGDPVLFQTPNRNQQQSGVCVPPISKGRRLGEGIEKAEAEKACAGHKDIMKKMCVVDVMAMGDLEVANIHDVY